MIPYCVNKWNENCHILEEQIRKDSDINSSGYSYLVKLVVDYILNPTTSEDFYEKWDSEKIEEIDHGNYQGTLLYLIPADTYQPGEYEYLMTWIGYGSCSICDTLLAIQDCQSETITENQVSNYMMLCKDLVCNMIKPYNMGWRNQKEFDQIQDGV